VPCANAGAWAFSISPSGSFHPVANQIALSDTESPLMQRKCPSGRAIQEAIMQIPTPDALRSITTHRAPATAALASTSR
jgi:hypothetical protein